MGEALGMIETRGLVAMIEAADAMVKAAKVNLVGWEKDRIGLRDRDGARATWRRFARPPMPAPPRRDAWAELISVHVIPRPHQSLEDVLPIGRSQAQNAGK